MSSSDRAPLRMHLAAEKWAFVEPFRITGYTLVAADVLTVTVEQRGCIGRGEAAGVYYRNDTVAVMLEQLARARASIEAGIDRQTLQEILPKGGARNAVDCALWDLQAKREQRAAWELAGLEQPRPLLTSFTCGANEPAKMAATARSYQGARALKLKLTGEAVDAERVCAVREARPDVWLGVDANQGFSPASLEKLMAALVRANVALIEQPFPVGQEALLDGFGSPIPIAADESIQGLSDLPFLAHRFNVVNIKLDKCGGLTEGMAIARKAREFGLEPMVGNMTGTSLAMAPAFLVGQLCSIVDLDGPIFLQHDRASTVQYRDGLIICPSELWG